MWDFFQKTTVSIDCGWILGDDFTTWSMILVFFYRYGKHGGREMNKAYEDSKIIFKAFCKERRWKKKWLHKLAYTSIYIFYDCPDECNILQVIYLKLSILKSTHHWQLLKKKQSTTYTSRRREFKVELV